MQHVKPVLYFAALGGALRAAVPEIHRALPGSSGKLYGTCMHEEDSRERDADGREARPASAFEGATVGHESLPPSAESILVVRACAIGDFVLNLPALRAVAAACPRARFTLVGYPATLALAAGFIAVSSIHSIESPPWSELFDRPRPGLAFDAALVWMKSPAVAENLTRSGVRTVRHAAPFPAHGHAAAHLLETVGLPAPELPDLWQPDAERIILHPGSGGRHKVWPWFEQLAALLPDAAILSGPCERGFPAANPRIERSDLTEVAEELRRCRRFIGNDSGMTHIAAYWGTPTVALFGPTDPQVWGPVGRRVDVLKRSSLADISIEEVRKFL